MNSRAVLSACVCLLLGMGVAASGATLSPNDPTIVGDLQLWLKSDAGVTADSNGFVSTWADQTVHGNNATSSGGGTTLPKLIADGTNPRPAIRFDGSNDYMQGALSTTLFGTNPSEGTVFVVLAPRSDGESNQEYVVQFQRGSGSSFMALVNDGYLSGGSIVNDNNSIGVFMNSSSPSGFVGAKGVNELSPDTRFVASFGFDNPGTGELFLRLDGTELESTSALAAWGSGFNGSSPLRIGIGGNSNFGGDIWAILVYDSALTTTQIEGVENYLTAYYSTPEPSTVAMLLGLAGIGLLGWMRRRRRS